MTSSADFFAVYETGRLVRSLLERPRPLPLSLRPLLEEVVGEEELGSELASLLQGALEHHFFAIDTLEVGTGRGSVAQALYHVLERAGEPRLVLGTTGKAAARMGQCWGAESRTVHRLLAEDRPLEAGVQVWVWEATMLGDWGMWKRLLERVVEAQGSLLLMGDGRQPPARGAGAGLALLQAGSSIHGRVRKAPVFFLLDEMPNPFGKTWKP